MNVIQYNTNKYGEFIPAPLKPAVSLAGAIKAERTCPASAASFVEKVLQYIRKNLTEVFSRYDME